MKTRIITGSLIAVVFIGILCGTLMVHPLFLDIFILLLSICAIYELWHCLYGKQNMDIPILSILIAFACFAALFFIDVGYLALGVCFAILILGVVAELIICMFSGRELNCVKNFILILFYPITLLVCLFAINHIIVEESAHALRLL